MADCHLFITEQYGRLVLQFSLQQTTIAYIIMSCKLLMCDVPYIVSPKTETLQQL